MNFLLTIKRILFNEFGQTPGTATGTSQVDPRILDYFLGVSKPSTGLLGEGAFSALGANPQQFSQMSGLPAMAGAQDLFRVNPAEAEQLSLGESKARENILQNVPGRGGELDQELAQNIMHYGGLRQKLIENRRNEALTTLQGLSGFKIPPAQTVQQRETGPTGASTGSQLLSALGGLGVQALNPLLTGVGNQLTGLLGLGTNPFAGQTASLAGTGWDNMNLLSPSSFNWSNFTDPYSNFITGLFT